jgi:hypothetical protein
MNVINIWYYKDQYVTVHAASGEREKKRMVPITRMSSLYILSVSFSLSYLLYTRNENRQESE